MKNILTVIFAITIITSVFACNNSNSGSIKKTDKIANDSINENTIFVYYFHGSIRCHTCVSVDENTHKYLNELFSDAIKKGKIKFYSINIDKNERADLVKKYKIWGQTLLFIKGGISVDKTDEAFKYVTTKPEKWKQIVKQTINDLTI